jgi:hypothetical protein
LAESHWDALDKKADDVARYAGLVVTVVGVLAAVAGAQVRYPGVDRLPWAWVAAAFLLALAALGCAVTARVPTDLPTPGPARPLLDFAARSSGGDDGQIKAFIAASLHAATVELRLLVESKARAIAVSYWLLVVSLLLLVVPLLVAAIGR